MKLIKILIPCLLLGACLGTSQQSKFYTQTVASTGAVSADFASFVGVNRIQLPKYIDRPQMVTQQADSAQVTISEYNRWVEFPSVLATRAVTENLGFLLPASQIKVNQLRGEKYDWTVSVEIVKMNAILGDKAEIEAWFTIKNRSGQQVVHQKVTKTALIGKSYDDMAKGYSQLLAAISRDIAEVLIRQ